jgi:hypothetical protein
MFYRSSQRHTSGMMLIHFIFIYPLFFLLIFIGIEVYWVLHVRHIVSVAAEEGTRAMAHSCVTGEEAVNITQQYLSLAGLSANFEITANEHDPLDPQLSSVIIQVPYKEVLLTGINIFADETLSLKVAMYRSLSCDQLL